MPRVATTKRSSATTSLCFEATLWAVANKLRGNFDAAEYKYVVLGLIFLKSICAAFEEKHAAPNVEEARTGANPQDRDEYLAENVFWILLEAHWSYLHGRAKDPLIDKLFDSSMIAIERDNPSLKNMLPQDYTGPQLDKQSLISTIGLGDAESRSKDIIGRIYEYFFSKFAGAEGKKAGQFCTPRCVVQLLGEMLASWSGDHLRDDIRWRFGGPPVGNANFAWVQHFTTSRLRVWPDSSWPTEACPPTNPAKAKSAPGALMSSSWESRKIQDSSLTSENQDADAG